MIYDPIRSDCLEKLLQGKVICEIKSPDGFRLLQDERQWDEANRILQQFGRRLVQTKDGDGIYLAYDDITDGDVSRKVARQLTEVAKDHWEALVYWLRCTQRVDDDNFPLRAGDSITQGALMEVAENSPTIQNEITKIARGLKVSATEPQAQIQGILNWMVNNDFLVKKTGVAHYEATARWSLLRDQMEYVKQQEGIVAAEDLDNPEETQQELPGV